MTQAAGDLVALIRTFQVTAALVPLGNVRRASAPASYCWLWVDQKGFSENGKLAQLLPDPTII